MPAIRDLAETILAAWRTNHQVTVFLVSHVPTAVWTAPVPGARGRRRPRWHRSNGSLQELVRARMETGDVAGQKIERLGTDGAVGFDGEGQIRRR